MNNKIFFIGYKGSLKYGNNGICIYYNVQSSIPTIDKIKKKSEENIKILGDVEFHFFF